MRRSGKDVTAVKPTPRAADNTAAAADNADVTIATALLARHGKAVNAYLDAVCTQLAGAPPRLVEAIRYSVEAGGKRLRPALLLECHHACGGAEGDKSAVAAAAAMELIHTFSLVHDDLPAMDDDDLRRGRPTNHKVFGEAMAILAGDAMVTLAFERIAADADPKLVPALVRELAANAGPVGMIGGQVLDIDGENKTLSVAELQQIHRMKTGALLTASCRMGAICAGASVARLGAITAFGRHLGLAFQIVDDLLDVTSTPEQLGKATTKDVDRGKNTSPSVRGLVASRWPADEQVAAALAALEEFGPAADGLRAAARFVTARNT
jgi:geranylgeranyl diphosphate synthase type II